MIPETLNSSTDKFPVYTSIPAGFPCPALDYMQERLSLDELLINHPASTFFIKVEGASMINAFIPSGAYLLIDRSLDPADGDIVVAVVNSEFTVKILKKENGGVTLLPANPNYNPLRITEEMNFSVWGVVSRIIIDPRTVKYDSPGRLQ